MTSATRTAPRRHGFMSDRDGIRVSPFSVLGLADDTSRCGRANQGFNSGDQRLRFDRLAGASAAGDVGGSDHGPQVLPNRSRQTASACASMTSSSDGSRRAEPPALGREHEHRRSRAGEDVVEVRGRDVRHRARARQGLEHLDRALVDRTHVAVDEVVHPRAVGLGLLHDDPMQLRVPRREDDELAHAQLRAGDLVDAA